MSLIDQLRRKSGRRRSALGRSAVAAPPGGRNDLLPRLELANIRLCDLRPSTRKLRKLDPAHVKEVAAAIRAFGFCEPLLVGRGDKLIHGEVRFEAARLLGLDCAPCIRVDHLGEDEQRVLRLAVNRLAEKGEWDFEALRLEMNELIVVDAPIEVSGFTLEEIDQIVIGDEPDGIEQGPLTPEATALAIARPGDIFQLGAHRLICGDAADPATLRLLWMGDPQARLVLTDEPYNVPIACHVTGGAHREFAMASGEMTDDQFLAFNVAWMGAIAEYLCDGGVFGTFIDWRGAPIVAIAADSLGLTPLNLVVWTKTNAGMGSLYRSQHELLPLFKKGAAPHVNNVQLGKRGRWRSNVWTYPGASSLGSEARRGLQDHPTVKPTAMLEDALLDLANRGDTVVDPFLGSGSTLMAAEATGRVCRGVEIDALYVDVIVRRFQNATGKAAIMIGTGEAFEALAVRRAIETAAESSKAKSREPPKTSGDSQ
jgi:DNA modification methylase